jgi:hypothetical protein
MSKLHDFLVEHANLPFPPLNEDLSSSATDMSALDVNLLEIEWKAKLAVRDDTLVQKLCDTLEDVLGDAPLAERAEIIFWRIFRLEFNSMSVAEKTRIGPRIQMKLIQVFPDVHHSKPSNFELTLGAESELARQGVLRRRK